MSEEGTIGFRVKTGRAIAVLLAGPAASPRVLQRREVQLWDPAVPESQEPYHAALELSGPEGARVVQRAAQAVKAVAVREVRQLVEELRAHGHRLRSVGLVVGSDIDPETLGNPHIRAHASEGRLFREALEAGAAACGVPAVVLVERDAYEKAAAALKQPGGRLQRAVTEMGRLMGRPWRAEEKAAALAAWVALTR